MNYEKQSWIEIIKVASYCRKYYASGTIKIRTTKPEGSFVINFAAPNEASITWFMSGKGKWIVWCDTDSYIKEMRPFFSVEFRESSAKLDLSHKNLYLVFKELRKNIIKSYCPCDCLT